MTRTYEECMLAILASPEDDALRRELASIVQASDPLLAEFIELQLTLTDRERARLPRNTFPREWQLADENRRRWARNLDFYLGEDMRHRDVEFRRGLPWLCTMNPYMFLEQGEYILTRVAPLRGIKFYADPEGDPFPAKELAACPSLARLDEIRFDRFAASKDELEILVSSPHLVRVRAWDFREVQVSAGVWEAIAANPAARGAFMIQSDYKVPSDGGPIDEVAASFDRVWISS